MQVANAAPRDNLTAATVTALLQAENLTVSAGLELYDADETFIEDISDDLVDGMVDRGNYRTIHGTCRLSISRELVWGSQRVKPYLTIATAGGEPVTWDGEPVVWDGEQVTWGDGGVTARFDLGVFLLSTPQRRVGESPVVYEVDGFDKLEILNHPHGTTYSADAGDAYLTLVEDLITDAGETKILLDGSASATTLPTARVWQIDEGTTTLNIVNDLLSAVGYRALWVDQDGYYRSEPYVSPADRGAEWTYNADSASTMIAEDRIASADFFDTPNRWVFILDDPAATTFPTEGDGVYTVTNQSDGPTSIDGRGRTITRIVRLSAADQDSLESQGDRIVENDKRLDERLSMAVSPNPLHAHFDRISVTDAELGYIAKRMLVTDWSLPLDGSDMQIELKAV